MAKSNKRVKKLKRKTNTKRISYKNKSRKLIRKKMRKSVNKKRTKVGGASKQKPIERLLKNQRIHRLMTDNVNTVQFSKLEDKPDMIEKLIIDAAKILNNHGRIILSIVWPNGSYPDGPDGLPHQAHTFAISIDTDNDTLIVFDNHSDEFYHSKEDETKNYKIIISNIKNKFNIKNTLFFQDIDWCKKTKRKIENVPIYKEQFKFEHTVGEGTGEGVCQAHASALEKLGLIRVFSEYTPEEKKRYLIDEAGDPYGSNGKEEKE
mgnify:CR=1 FL=1|tara:strand:- start:2638 stop:3426 length:789 start_codon:yes stop_codon:yes gene_type:complete